MVTVTIPKEITKGDELVVLSRSVYEQFLRVLKTKSASSTVHKKLDKGLQEALADVRKGRVLGPFSSVKDGLYALKHAK